MHKTSINGAEYDVTGGKALVGGTSYGISKGRTLIGGTGYDISFGTWRDRFIRLMQNATLVKSAGRSSSSENTVSISFSRSSDPSGVYYIFTFYSGSFTISKAYWDASSGNLGTLTKLSDLFIRRKTGSSWVTMVKSSDSNYAYIGSYNETTQRETIYDSINAGGIFAFQFSGFVEENIDNILSAFTVQNVASGDWSSTDYLYVPETTNALLVQYASYVALSFPYGTVIFSNDTYGGEPFSLLWQGYGNYYLSKSPSDGRSRTYGGNIIEL